jgi:hypothetical protein
VRQHTYERTLAETKSTSPEEEFQIVDPHTRRELRLHVSEILEEGKMLLGEQVKPEMISRWYKWVREFAEI